HPKLGAYAEEILRRLGVEVRTGTLVDRATDDSVTPAGGDPIGAKTVVWSAGVRPTDPAGGESPRSGSHRLETDQYLRLKEQPDVYVIGDAASVSTPEGELPMLSPPAMQEGRYVARS